MHTSMNGMSCSTVFFSGAGSFGSEFQVLMDALPPEAWSVRYPGRYGKDFGVPAESFEAVVRACTDQVVSRVTSRALLFGHSFGAYVAFATALRLQEAGAGACGLVVAGAAAPGRLEVSEQATGTPSEVARYLDSVDPSMLADAPSEDWREVVVETATHDLRLLRQFEAASGERVRCPILAIRGTADPLASETGVGEWQQYTEGGFSLCSFPGGHSDFLRSPACASWIREAQVTLVGP